MSDSTTTGQPPQPDVEERVAPASAGASGAAQPSEEELRAAYEAELIRITSADLILQTAASLLNLGARRLGLLGGESGPARPGEGERDLEQVRDAIDGVRGLMPVLERRVAQPAELRALRDALSQLQMAYAREAPRPPADAAPGEPASDAAPAAGRPAGSAAGQPGGQPGTQQPRRPGPAEASGRLWVPGR